MKQHFAIAMCLGSLGRAAVDGFDISHFQESVDFQAAYDSGARFVMIKATEGTNYEDPVFSQHYSGATDAGLLRGGYHFAQPASSAGADQAKYFIEHGGNWTGDGMTLPGMLDLEANPDAQGSGGDECYGLGPEAMVDWITDFAETYHEATSIYPLLYTGMSWWESCTGNSEQLGQMCPLVVARYAEEVGELPAGWDDYSFWQFDDAYEFGGDSQTFNGDEEQLKAIAKPE